MRFFFLLMSIVTVFYLIAEVFFESWNVHTFFSHDDPAKYDDSYFSKTTWIIITSLSVAIMSLCLVKTCGLLIKTMENFKFQKYFVLENATNFKSSSIYFLLALVVIPIITNILHKVDYMISSSYMENNSDKKIPGWMIQISSFISEKIPGLIVFMVVGLFLYVMGEVVQKAVDVKDENDLTI